MYMTFGVFDVKSHMENEESVHFLEAVSSGQLLDCGLETLK